MKNINITTEQAGERLDVFLTNHLNLPRTRIQKAIKGGEVLINETQVKPHTKIAENDTVSYKEGAFVEETIVKAKPPALEILFEDEDVLVSNKPAGLIVHEAGPEKGEATLVDAVLAHAPDIKTVGDDETRPGIVHRLDKDVSGVMVVAKTQKAFDQLKQQFQDRTVEKDYLALVYGKIEKDHGEMNFKIARSKAKGRMVARAAESEEEGKDALTEFDVLDRFKQATYVRVKIHSGRTHQIRVHFLAIDHPIVGDKLHTKKQLTNIRRMNLDRLFLHATRLAFTLPTGERKTFEVPLPSELQSILDSLPKK